MDNESMMALSKQLEVEFDSLVENCLVSGAIDLNLYQEYDVKRGLRDSSGKGVLTGLTEISDVTGYDIVNDLDGVLAEFDSIIGLDRLKAVHLNDSMMPFGGKKDRHAVIGEGEIGLNAIINFMSHPKLNKLPFFLETPLEDEGHKKEIAMIKEILSDK